MSKGRRYNGEKQLNLKKVFAVILFIIIIILSVIGIRKILKADKENLVGKNIPLHYYTIFANGNWGVINSKGETVIEPAYAEMIVIPDKTKPVFLCTYDVNYVDGTYKTKAINEKNQEIYSGYELIATVQNYDQQNNLWYEENVLQVKKDGKYGLINLNGNQILPCEYDSLTTLKGIKNSIIVKKDGKMGLVNIDGSVIIPTEYQTVAAINEDYQNGYIVKNAEGKFGVINSEGHSALQFKYDDIKRLTENNMYVVKSNGTWKVVLGDDTIYLDGKVANAVEMSNGNVIVNDNGNYKLFNIQTEAQVITDYEYLTYTFDNNYIAKKDGKFGIINSNNETLVEFKYTNIEYNKTTDYLKATTDAGTFDYMTRDLTVKLNGVSETILGNGYIKINVGNQVKYYNYKLEEKSNKEVYSSNTLFVNIVNGKYGFVDKEGKTIVEPNYDYALEQNEYGYSAIKKDGKWGAIDQYGNVVIAPTYLLSNNSIIDFIGTWHVCADTNANYYTNVD